MSVISFILILSWMHTHAQPIAQKDLSDVLKGSKKDTSSRSKDIEVGRYYFSPLPIVGYAPANGFILGAALSISSLMDPRPTKLSSALINLQATSKKQLIFNARSKVFLNGNRWTLQGDWRFMLFSQPTYGLGIRNSDNPEFSVPINGYDPGGNPLAEDMRFNYIRFYEDVVKRIGDGSVSVGLGLAIDIHSSIKDQRLNISGDSTNFYETQHYKYSIERGFNTTSYNTTGIRIIALSDTRDNTMNAFSGHYLYGCFRYNVPRLANSQYSLQAEYDARYYLSLSEITPRKVLAFWSYGQFLVAGNIPYLALPSVGWDAYNRSARGYIQGRYRGLNMFYNEIEYRYPISKNGLWGGTLFVNNTNISSDTQQLFERFAYAAGAGIRLTMDKRTRVNLTVDIAYGLDNSTAIYFNLQEYF